MLRRAYVLAVVTALAAGGLVACGGQSASPDKAAAQRFLDALGHGDVAAAAAATSDPAAATGTLTASLTGLGAGAKGTLAATTVSRQGSARHGALRGVVDDLWCARAVDLHRAALRMAKRGGDWKVVWSPADLAPQLRTGEHLALKRSLPPRAALLDSSGRALMVPTPVVNVGIRPSFVKDLASLAAALTRALHQYGVATKRHRGQRARSEAGRVRPGDHAAQTRVRRCARRDPFLAGHGVHHGQRTARSDKPLRPAAARAGRACYQERSSTTRRAAYATVTRPASVVCNASSTSN